MLGDPKFFSNCEEWWHLADDLVKSAKTVDKQIPQLWNMRGQSRIQAPTNDPKPSPNNEFDGLRNEEPRYSNGVFGVGMLLPGERRQDDEFADRAMLLGK